MASSREVFQLRGSTVEEVTREANAYFQRLARQLDDLQGLIAATKQFNDLNLQGKRITNLGDPSANDDAQKKALSLSRSSPAGNWDAGGKKITNGAEGTNPTDVVIVRQVQSAVAGEVGTHSHQSATTGGQLDHGLALTGLTDDDHTQYRLESENHTHQSPGVEAGQLDHGLALTGLGDDDHPQYRLESENHTHQSSGAQAGTLDHGLALTGLTDDDHTQYGLLAGRAGGQTLTGGTAASEDLTLQSTSHATKGNIVLNPDGGNIGMGTASEFGGGARVVGLVNASTVPSTNPTGGGALYAEAGALKWRGSAGTVTTIAPA